MRTETSGSSFVARTEREHLLLRFAELVMAHGFDNVTLADLADQAGVERKRLARYFQTKEECALAVVDTASEQMFSAAGRAFFSAPDDPPLAARAALDAVLRFFAGMPGFVHLAVVEYKRLGVPGADARRHTMDAFAALLGPGFAAARPRPPQPETLSRLIAGGIYELVGRHYTEGRLDQLPEALPTVTYFAVAPFFGRAEARRVSSLPASTAG